MANLSIFGNRKPAPVKLVEIINKYASDSRKSRAYKNRYWCLARKLDDYQKYRGIVLMTDSFTYNTFDDFIHFMNSNFPYRSSTLKHYQSDLKHPISIAERKGILVEKGFYDFDFKQDEVATVYLKLSELETIRNLTHLSKSAKVARDLFLVGCFTGMRYSDYSRLTSENIVDDFIQIKTKKTGIKVMVPISAAVREIIKRYDGFPRWTNSQQNFNKMIKRICKRAKIEDKILIERYEGAKPVKRTLRKYELVTSHTARRTFATNAYLSGIPSAKIMLLTGHKTEAAFFQYIRISKQENAADLSTHTFFQ